MFQIPQNTAAIIDSTSFFLRRQIPVYADTAKKGFSEFEYLSTDSSRLFFRKNTITIVKKSMHEGHQGIPMPFPPMLTSGFFILFLLCFVFFSRVIHREGNALTGNLKNIFSFGARDKSVYKEQITTSETWGEIFLVVQAIVLLSIVLFIYFWKDYIREFPFENQSFIFAGIALLLSLFLGAKYLVYKATGAFLIPSGIDDWIERYFRIIELMGIVLFLPAMFFVYMNQYGHIAALMLVILFLASRIVILWGLLSIFVKYKIGFLYFIVYLCGVEIIPCFFLYGGVVFLIKTVGNIVL